MLKWTLNIIICKYHRQFCSMLYPSMKYVHTDDAPYNVTWL